MPLLFLLTIDMGRQNFTTYLPVPPPSSTRGKAQPSDQQVWGLSAMDMLYQHQGPQKVVALSTWHDATWL
jgi:hypothetical protein